MEYVNELANVKPANIIPDFVTSVDEAAAYVSEANERNLTDMDKKLNLIEARYFERTGRHIITEDSKKTSVFAKVKDFLVEKVTKLWEFIKAAWTKVVTAIKDLCASVSAKLKATFGSTNDVEKQLMAYAGDKKKVVGKVHDFEGIDQFNAYHESIKKAISNAQIWKGQLYDNFNAGGKSLKSDVSATNKANSDDNKVTINEFIRPIIKAGKDKLIKFAEGEEHGVTVADLQRSFKVYVNYGTNFAAASKLSKALYNVSKQQCQNLQKEIKGLKDINTKKISAFVGQISTALTILTNASTKVAYDQNREYAKLVLAARKLNATAKKPSGEVAESASMDLDTLFAE